MEAQDDTAFSVVAVHAGADRERRPFLQVDGDLDVESVPGRGTTVCVVLPLAGEVSAA